MTGAFSLAVHALVYLNHKAVTLSSEMLAENICTNPARIRKVMSQLKRAGLISTKEGINGGYHFEGNVQSITLRQIAEVVDTQFVSVSWHSGSEDKDCLVASGMAQIMDGIYARLNQECLSRLEQITLADIDRQIFRNSSSTKEE